MTMDIYAVIPTCDRPRELDHLIYSLRDNGVDAFHTLIIDNGTQPLNSWYYRNAVIVQDDDRTPHIYQQWNFGLEWAAVKHADGRKDHMVMVLNDDVVLPLGFAVQMENALTESGATIAFPNQHGLSTSTRLFEPGPINLVHRVTGYAFAVAGQHGIRCDEDFKWWYGDDDLDWRARADYYGTIQVQDATVRHLHPNVSTTGSEERTGQAGRDRETFIRKHGKAPW
jgi:GT2 family glycosyltransferase